MNATRQTATGNDLHGDPHGDPHGDAQGDARRIRRFKRHEFALVAVVVCGLGVSAGLARWLELRQPPAAAQLARTSDELYLKPEQARRLSLGFNAMAADWYWMRTLQYVGRKVTSHKGAIQIDDLSAVNLKILAPLLENATTLDPQFLAAYEYGAIVLPAVDVEAAIKLVKKGIAANPRAWRLHSYLGYIYWQQNRFQEASEAYAAAARVPGAPAWLPTMSAQMATKGGSRETARAIYENMYRQTDDEQMKKLSLARLLQLRSLDEMDALGSLLDTHRARAGRCPLNWREVAPALRAARFQTDASAAPLDPSGVPYVIKQDGCGAELGEGSEIIRKY
jgi:tetratricopeptide (TPR) repeat protein